MFLASRKATRNKNHTFPLRNGRFVIRIIDSCFTLHGLELESLKTLPFWMKKDSLGQRKKMFSITICHSEKYTYPGISSSEPRLFDKYPTHPLDKILLPAYLYPVPRNILSCRPQYTISTAPIYYIATVNILYCAGRYKTLYLQTIKTR